MKAYEITFEVRGTEQFLVVRQEQEEYLNEYLAKMLEYNSIAGILPLKSQNMNGRTVLNYQLGSRFRLIDLIKQNKIGSAEARLIYDRLAGAIAGMGEYFLNADQCVYELDYLYVDATLNPYLVYLPFENVRNHEISRVWREFFLNLLSYFSDGKQDPFYDKLMRYLIQPQFSLKEFRTFLAEPASGETSQLMSVQDQMAYSGSGAAAESLRAQKEDIPQPKEPIQPAPNVAIPGVPKPAVSIPGAAAKPAESVVPKPTGKAGKTGISIPGLKKPAEPTQPAPEKNSKEKKQVSLFGFGKKKADGGITAPLPEVIPSQPAVPTGSGEGNGPAWSGTVMIRPDEEKRTVMLNAAQPHLLNNGAYVPMEQFPFTIGKGSANYIVANQTVSRLHATILRQGNEYFVRDEDSTNGTFLNGRKLNAGEPVKINDGDRLRMSNEEFTFHTS